MIVITSGDKYLDIDAYSSMIGYAKYLKLKNINCICTSSAILNESITDSIRNLSYKLDLYKPSKKDEFVIIDVSDKRFFDRIVDINNIIEIIDHHMGHEQYWNNILGKNANILAIGSCATFIYELFEKDNLVKYIDKELAILLMAGILNNTLNLKYVYTTKRDIKAYNKLKEISGINNYDEIYYKEYQKISFPICLWLLKMILKLVNLMTFCLIYFLYLLYFLLMI